MINSRLASSPFIFSSINVILRIHCENTHGVEENAFVWPRNFCFKVDEHPQGVCILKNKKKQIVKAMSGFIANSCTNHFIC